MCDGESGSPLSAAEFRALMNTVAQGWNEGDSMKSARCFAKNAVYMEPPDLQAYEGRDALYAFFGGEQQPPSPGRMTWHHLIFDEEEQIGAGEYTYQGNHRLHGMVVVHLTAGMISHWREYQRASSMTWDEFVGKSKF